MPALSKACFKAAIVTLLAFKGPGFGSNLLMVATDTFDFSAKVF